MPKKLYDNVRGIKKEWRNKRTKKKNESVWVNGEARTGRLGGKKERTDGTRDKRMSASNAAKLMDARPKKLAMITTMLSIFGRADGDHGQKTAPRWIRSCC
jgi:hypothetical protein